MNDPQIFLKIRNLSKSFSSSRVGERPGTARKVLKDLSFDIHKGEILGIAGSSGSGKTTLGRSLLGLPAPDSGSIEYQGINLTALSAGKFRQYRRKFQMISQDPARALNPLQKVLDCLTEALLTHPRTAKTTPAAAAVELLAMVGLSPAYLYRLPHEMSGGEKQRVAIARALAMSPEFIIADEPTSNLDGIHKRQIVNLLMRLNAKLNIAILFISHDVPLLSFLADRIGIMHQGRIAEIGLKKEILHSPETEAAIQLIAAAKAYETKS